MEVIILAKPPEHPHINNRTKIEGHLSLYPSIFFCVEVISSTVVLRKQRNNKRFGTIHFGILRFGMIQLK